MSYRITNTESWPKLPKSDSPSPELAWFKAGAYCGFFTGWKEDALQDIFDKLALCNREALVSDDSEEEVLYHYRVAKALRAWQGEEKWQKMLQMLSITPPTTPTPQSSASSSVDE